MKNKLIKFFKAEQVLMNKSDSFMKGVYKNRVKANLDGEREVIIFIVDKLWELFFSKKLNDEQVKLITYGFEQLVWKKELKEAIINHIEYRKANLK